jgi:hypothetical protein
MAHVHSFELGAAQAATAYQRTLSELNVPNCR